MSNEAVIIELIGQPKGQPITYQIAPDVAVEKGTLMKMSGAGTTRPFAVAATAASDVFAGIASVEHDASDTGTTLGLWTKGVFDLLFQGGTGAIGDDVAISGANAVAKYTSLDAEQGFKVGKLLEGATDAEVVQVAVGVY